MNSPIWWFSFILNSILLTIAIGIGYYLFGNITASILLALTTWTMYNTADIDAHKAQSKHNL